MHRAKQYILRATTNILGVVLLAALVCSAGAATLSVEKDGSGDFTVIQDAIDASQPGDTIQIGPGRYDDFQEFWFSGGYSVQTIAGVAHPLTLRGTDRNVVIVGPSMPTGTVDDQTHALSVDTGVVGVLVEDLTFENTWDLVWVDTAVTLRRCTLRRSGQQAIELSSANGMVIDECLIAENVHGSAIFSPAGFGNQFLSVTNSTFENNEVAMSLASVENGVVSACTFRGHVVAIQLWADSSGCISACTFQSTASIHVSVSDTSIIEVVDSVFDASARSALRSSQTGHLIGRGNDVSGGSFATAHIQGSGAQMTLEACDIGNTGGWSVYAATEVPQIDFRNNYWGTSDPAQIREWIYDREDDERLAEVLFEPFSEMPVPAEPESIGGVKARFAPER